MKALLGEVALFNSGYECNTSIARQAILTALYRDTALNQAASLRDPYYCTRTVVENTS